jgi:hypothetical protein
MPVLPPPQPWIVTGFVDGINQRADRDPRAYLALGRVLLETVHAHGRARCVAFVPRRMVPSLRSGLSLESHQATQEDTEREARFTYTCRGGVLDGGTYTFSYQRVGNVFLVPFEREDLWLWRFRALGHRFHVHTGNPQKDTLEYMFVQCQKPEWMALAVALCQSLQDSVAPPAPPLFVWMDFGIFHMFSGHRDRFAAALGRACHAFAAAGAASNALSFGRCWDPLRLQVDDGQFHVPAHVYTDIDWTFAGSVFYGTSSPLLDFAHRMRDKCLQLLRERNALMWEINVWILLLAECPALFAFYWCDHNEHIFGVQPGATDTVCLERDGTNPSE